MSSKIRIDPEVENFFFTAKVKGDNVSARLLI